jgi:hypothetical protein
VTPIFGHIATGVMGIFFGFFTGTNDNFWYVTGWSNLSYLIKNSKILNKFKFIHMNIFCITGVTSRIRYGIFVAGVTGNFLQKVSRAIFFLSREKNSGPK